MKIGAAQILRRLKIAGIALPASLAISLSADDYPKLDYEKVPFPDGGLSFDPREKSDVLNAFAAVAGNFDQLPNSTRAKAVALSRRIDPLHKATFVADYQLRRGVVPDRISELSSEPEVAESIYRFALSASRRPDKNLQSFSGLALNFLTEFQPDVVDYSKAYKVYTDKFGEVSWDSIFSEIKSAPVASFVAGEMISAGFLTTNGVFQIKTAGMAGGGEPLSFKADNFIGTPILQSAFHEGIKYLGQRRSGMVTGLAVELSVDSAKTAKFFEEQGPAAALGCVLSVQAMLDKVSFDSSVAFAGDVNADGSVQPLGDLRERLLGLDSSASLIIGIPMVDSPALEDILILSGPEIFAKYQIFGLKSMDSATDLSRNSQDRPEKLQTAIAKFREIQAVLKKPGGIRLLHNGHVLNRLREVTELAPNHLSAKMLALSGANQLPPRLSLNASLDLVMDPLDNMIFEGNIPDSPLGEIAPTALAELDKFKGKIDLRLASLSRAVVAYSSAGRVGSDKIEMQKNAWERLKGEMAAVMRDIAVREEMMR